MLSGCPMILSYSFNHMYYKLFFSKLTFGFPVMPGQLTCPTDEGEIYCCMRYWMQVKGRKYEFANGCVRLASLLNAGRPVWPLKL